MMPPPTPSSPARVPETRPVAAIASARPASHWGSRIAPMAVGRPRRAPARGAAPTLRYRATAAAATRSGAGGPRRLALLRAADAHHHPVQVPPTGEAALEPGDRGCPGVGC